MFSRQDATGFRWEMAGSSRPIMNNEGHGKLKRVWYCI